MSTAKKILPIEHVFSHQYCFFLHDQLVEILKSGAKADIFSHEWIPKSGEALPPDGICGETLFDWLKVNGRDDVIFGLYYKQICAALVSDFLHFVFEALTCSSKGKLTVAYALLRKPFKENLFYLEWLLADPKEMLKAFDGSPEQKSINKRFSEDGKKAIIRRALEVTKDGEIFPADFIYDLRYNKNFPAGYESMFQKANHLVTSFRFMETETGNFNFIFSDEDSWHSQWDALYSFLPILLFHTVQVVEAIVSRFAKRVNGIDLTSVRTMIGLGLWMEQRSSPVNASDIFQAISEALQEISCPECGNFLDNSYGNLKMLYEKNRLGCGACGWICDIDENLSNSAGDWGSL